MNVGTSGNQHRGDTAVRKMQRCHDAAAVLVGGQRINTGAGRNQLRCDRVGIQSCRMVKRRPPGIVPGFNVRAARDQFVYNAFRIPICRNVQRRLAVVTLGIHIRRRRPTTARRRRVRFRAPQREAVYGRTRCGRSIRRRWKSVLRPPPDGHRTQRDAGRSSPPYSWLCGCSIRRRRKSVLRAPPDAHRAQRDAGRPGPPYSWR